MDFTPTAEHELIRQTMRDFAQQKVAPIAASVAIALKASRKGASQKIAWLSKTFEKPGTRQRRYRLKSAKTSSGTPRVATLRRSRRPRSTSTPKASGAPSRMAGKRHSAATESQATLQPSRSRAKATKQRIANRPAAGSACALAPSSTWNGLAATKKSVGQSGGTPVARQSA